MSDSVRPHRWQPTRLPRPWDSPGKNTGVGCISFSNAWKWKVKSLSCAQLFTTPWIAAHQAPLSMGFSRQEYWSGLPLPSPMTNLDSILKTRDFANKGPSNQSYGFSSSHVWMWELDRKEDWPQKNWCFWTVVLEKTLEIPLDCKEFKPVNPKGNQPWVFIGRTDAVAEAPILWHLIKKPDSLAKTLMLGK